MSDKKKVLANWPRLFFIYMVTIKGHIIMLKGI
jgi:hypothetical protein